MVADPHFLDFPYKLFKGVIRDQPQVPIRVQLDRIKKVIHLISKQKKKKKLEIMAQGLPE
jgi:hypothetical protein